MALCPRGMDTGPRVEGSAPNSDRGLRARITRVDPIRHSPALRTVINDGRTAIATSTSTSPPPRGKKSIQYEYRRLRPRTHGHGLQPRHVSGSSRRVREVGYALGFRGRSSIGVAGALETYDSGHGSPRLESRRWLRAVLRARPSNEGSCGGRIQPRVRPGAGPEGRAAQEIAGERRLARRGTTWRPWAAFEAWRGSSLKPAIQPRG